MKKHIFLYLLIIFAIAGCNQGGTNSSSTVPDSSESWSDVESSSESASESYLPPELLEKIPGNSMYYNPYMDGNMEGPLQDGTAWFEEDGKFALQKADGTVIWIEEGLEIIASPNPELNIMVVGTYDMAYYGLINSNGEIITPVVHDSSTITLGFDDTGLAQVTLIEDYYDRSKWYQGYIDQMGAYVIEPKYYSEFFFEGGELWVATDPETGLSGAFNQQGEIAIPFMYEGMRAPYHGIIPFAENGKWGFMDLNGSVKVSPQFDAISDYGGYRTYFWDDRTIAFPVYREVYSEPTSPKNVSSFLYTIFQYAIVDIQGNILYQSELLSNLGTGNPLHRIQDFSENYPAINTSGLPVQEMDINGEYGHFGFSSGSWGVDQMSLYASPNAPVWGVYENEPIYTVYVLPSDGWPIEYISVR